MNMNTGLMAQKSSPPINAQKYSSQKLQQAAKILEMPVEELSAALTRISTPTVPHMFGPYSRSFKKAVNSDTHDHTLATDSDSNMSPPTRAATGTMPLQPQAQLAINSNQFSTHQMPDLDTHQLVEESPWSGNTSRDDLDQLNESAKSSTGLRKNTIRGNVVGVRHRLSKDLGRQPSLPISSTGSTPMIFSNHGQPVSVLNTNSPSRAATSSTGEFGHHSGHYNQKTRVPEQPAYSIPASSHRAPAPPPRPTPHASSTAVSSPQEFSLPTTGPFSQQPQSTAPLRPTNGSLDIFPLHQTTRKRPRSEETLRLEDVIYGPCSHTWTQQRMDTVFDMYQSAESTIKRTRPPHEKHLARGAFNAIDRSETARTRQLTACIRCRFQATRCRRDPDDESGPCMTCKQLKRPTSSGLPCLRYNVTDASLYREQPAPYPLFSKRWQNMELAGSDITEWASDEIKVINLTQTFLDAPFTLRVRKFVPKEGDMLSERWQDGDVERTHPIPPYAMVSLEETAEMYRGFIERNTYLYIDATLSPLSQSQRDFFYPVYTQLFKQINAKNGQEARLAADTLRLWVTCRISSHPHKIIGKETLGGKRITNPASPQYNSIPMPPIMIAQKELVIYSRFLTPLSKKVLTVLSELIYKNKREHWLTILLVSVILLHSCSLITRRDEEYARQINLKRKYANPGSIAAHHKGVQIILGHFHYINKGECPFQDAVSPSKLKSLQKDADLTDEQTELVKDMAQYAKENEAEFQRITKERSYGDDFYWVAQLFDRKWRPHDFEE